MCSSHQSVRCQPSHYVINKSSLLLLTIIATTLVPNSTPTTQDNLNYKEYWYKTTQLCPNPQYQPDSNNNPPTTTTPFNFIHYPNNNEPSQSCYLESQTTTTTARIEAIHIDTRAWDYTGSTTCKTQISLKLPEPTFLKRSYEPKIICRVTKEKSGLHDSITGSLFHPYVWQFPKGKLGVSFSTFNLTHLSSNDTVEPVTRTRNYWHDHDNPVANNNSTQYLQIVLTTTTNSNPCTIRIQQYVISPHTNQRNCNPTHRLCGLYTCTEKEQILKTLGFWAKPQQTTHKLEFNEQGCSNDDDGVITNKKLLQTYLRILMMPCLFITVFYLTRKLRIRLAMGGHHGSSNNDLNCNVDPRGLLQQHHVGLYDRGGDLPPRYEDIIRPPSYTEATNSLVKNDDVIGSSQERSQGEGSSGDDNNRGMEPEAVGLLLRDRDVVSA